MGNDVRGGDGLCSKASASSGARTKASTQRRRAIISGVTRRSTLPGGKGTAADSRTLGYTAELGPVDTYGQHRPMPRSAISVKLDLEGARTANSPRAGGQLIVIFDRM